MAKHQAAGLHEGVSAETDAGHRRPVPMPLSGFGTFRSSIVRETARLPARAATAVSTPTESRTPAGCDVTLNLFAAAAITFNDGWCIWLAVRCSRVATIRLRPRAPVNDGNRRGGLFGSQGRRGSRGKEEDIHLDRTSSSPTVGASQCVYRRGPR
jgi:hypothetical protein